MRCVADAERGGCGYLDASCGSLLARAHDHRRREIEPRDRGRAGLRGRRTRGRRCRSPDIDDAVAGPHEGSCRDPSPGMVAAGGHQRVHQVVAAGDLAEHLADVARALDTPLGLRLEELLWAIGVVASHGVEGR